MLVADMTRNFWLKVKSLDRTDIKDTQTYDVLFLLNQAQDILIDKLIDEKKFGDLRPITDSSTVLAAAFIATGVYDPGVNTAIVVDVSALASYRDYIRSASLINHSVAPVITAGTMQNEDIDPFDLFKFETNGTNKPIFTNPKAWLEGDYLIVLPDAFTSVVTSVDVIYIKIPTTLVLTTPASDTSDLPDHLHDSIVDIAVQISAETINVNEPR